MEETQTSGWIAALAADGRGLQFAEHGSHVQRRAFARLFFHSRLQALGRLVLLASLSSTNPIPTPKTEQIYEKELQKTGYQKCRSARQNLSEDVGGEKWEKRNQADTAGELTRQLDVDGKQEQRERHGRSACRNEDYLRRFHDRPLSLALGINIRAARSALARPMPNASFNA